MTLTDWALVGVGAYVAFKVYENHKTATALQTIPGSQQTAQLAQQNAGLVY